MRSRIPKAAWSAASAVLFLMVSLLVARYYFQHDPTHQGLIKTTYTNVYEKVDAAWLQPDTGIMVDELSKGKLTPFNQMILNAAMTRWRVQDRGPSAYSRLVSDFKRGWWNEGFVDELARVMQDLDRRWVEERRAALRTGGIVMPRGTAVKDAGFDLVFPDGMKTPMIGSLIEVAVVAGPASTPQQTVQAYWYTKQNPEVSKSRCRLCAVEQTKETSGTLPILKIRMDMADVPEWLHTATEPMGIIFRTDTPVDWQPLAFGLKDSPWLPVNSKP